MITLPLSEFLLITPLFWLLCFLYEERIQSRDPFTGEAMAAVTAIELMEAQTGWTSKTRGISLRPQAQFPNLVGVQHITPLSHPFHSCINLQNNQKQPNTVTT